MVKHIQRVVPENESILVNGLHEAIIDEATFSLAADKLARHGSPPVHLRGELKNPFAGLAVCAKCGKSLIYSACASGRYTRMSCPSRFCDNVSTDFEIFEKCVLETLNKWVEEYELEFTDIASRSDDTVISAVEKSLSASQSELETLNLQLARTHDLLEQGAYDTDTFLLRSRLLAEKINYAKSNIETLSGALSVAKQRAANRKNLIPEVKKIVSVYNALDSAKEKNAALKNVLERITYRRDNRSWRGGNRDNFEIVLYPVVPKS